MPIFEDVITPVSQPQDTQERGPGGMPPPGFRTYKRIESQPNPGLDHSSVVVKQEHDSQERDSQEHDSQEDEEEDGDMEQAISDDAKHISQEESAPQSQWPQGRKSHWSQENQYREDGPRGKATGGDQQRQLFSQVEAVVDEQDDLDDIREMPQSQFPMTQAPMHDDDDNSNEEGDTAAEIAMTKGTSDAGVVINPQGGEENHERVQESEDDETSKLLQEMMETEPPAKEVFLQARAVATAENGAGKDAQMVEAPQSQEDPREARGESPPNYSHLRRIVEEDFAMPDSHDISPDLVSIDTGKLTLQFDKGPSLKPITLSSSEGCVLPFLSFFLSFL